MADDRIEAEVEELLSRVDITELGQSFRTVTFKFPDFAVILLAMTTFDTTCPTPSCYA